MKERFEIQNTYEYATWQEGCPIFILKAQLINDNKEKAHCIQLAIRNTSSMQIKDISIELKGFNDFNEETFSKIYTYQDLTLKPDKVYGQGVLIRVDEYISRLDAKVISTTSKDGTNWKEDNNAEINMPEYRIIETNNDKYRIIADSNKIEKKYIKYYPIELNETSWRCTCGAINSGDQCLQCKTEKKDVFSLFDPEEMNRKLNEYRNRREEDIIRQEKLRDELNKSELIEKNKKKKRRLLTIGAVLLFGVCTFLVLYIGNVYGFKSMIESDRISASYLVKYSEDMTVGRVLEMTLPGGSWSKTKGRVTYKYNGDKGTIDIVFLNDSEGFSLEKIVLNGTTLKDDQEDDFMIDVYNGELDINRNLQ